MSDEQGGQAAPDTKDGLNIPAAIEMLLADNAALKERVAALETVDTQLAKLRDQLATLLDADDAPTAEPTSTSSEAPAKKAPAKKAPTKKRTTAKKKRG